MLPAASCFHYLLMNNLSSNDKGTTHARLFYMYGLTEMVTAEEHSFDGSGGCYRCLQDTSGKDRFEPLSSKNGKN